MYDLILVATDGSETSEEAVRKAAELADHTGAELHAIYVVETDFEYDNQIVDPERVARDLREEGNRALAVAERMAAEVGVQPQTAIERGIAHEQIVCYATDHDVDVIVVGARGRSDLKRTLFGSTTTRVIRLASRPVMVVDADDV